MIHFSRPLAGRDGNRLEMSMFIVQRLIKLALITAVFLTIFDLIAYGEVTWVYRLFDMF
ncbi:hypothetical protein ACRZ5S_18520 [Vibrio scophthalmi]|uniref:hypothetical protein n=1 Tax=Vibrio scophthalmi TaxID=45658 RepID=UPI0022835612|nr:hypothetical protein [Vibrio scophthalmi]MCY9803401.1 hypothetical protein [Vibrio scophthalmi]